VVAFEYEGIEEPAEQPDHSSKARWLKSPGAAQRNAGPLLALDIEREDAMVRDLLILAAASIVLGVIVWSVLGHQQRTSLQGSYLRMETSHSLNADPDLRLVSEQSPYMRTER